MTGYQIHMENNPNMARALAMARLWARAGDVYMTQAYLDHAQSFATVTSRQVKNLQKLLDKAQEGKT